MSSNHPYAEFESTDLWKNISLLIGELEKNDDLKITTAREYVIGYLCQRLLESGFGEYTHEPDRL